MKPYSKDLTGNRFGKLTVIRYVGKHPNNKHRSMWECICDCGNTYVTSVNSLNANHAKSCGCVGKITFRHNGRHKMSGTKEQNTYYGMMARCYNPKDKRYNNYGGRGIRVCDRWLNSIDDFFLDVGLAPSPKHTLDRWPNKNGDYAPDNFRWATQKEQQNNRTNNHIIEYNGLSLTLTQWTERTGISRGTMRYRLRAGWQIERLLKK